jgi:transposase
MAKNTATDTQETIGCDLGDKKSEICVLDANGKVQERISVRTTLKAMKEWFGRRPVAHVVMEVGAHSRWMSAALTELGHRVTVANPHRVKLISASDSKTDKHDAELLARLGRVDESLLAPVVHRGPQAQADLAVAKARDVLVATRSKLVNHVRGTVKAFGERLPTCSAESFAAKTRELVPAILKTALDPIYGALERINEQIDEQDKMIGRVAKKYPDVEMVSQIAGVGVLTALVFILTIEDKARFGKSRMVGAFFGLRARKSASGNEDPQLRITKAGDPFVRRLLVTAANYIMGPFGKDSDLRRWGMKLAQRGGKNARKRAKVAVARKLAVLMHRLWVTGEIYEPLGHYERQLEGKRQAA